MALHDFTPWPKTARLFRDIVVTEKLDGTNAAVHISSVPHIPALGDFPPGSYSVVVDGTRYVITAQSRKRIIAPGKTSDNYGFAGWTYANAEALVRVLGEGLHFGEWWGRGIQRGYGRESRSFSLFRAAHYIEQFPAIENGLELDGGALEVVPTLYSGAFSDYQICKALFRLRDDGSVAAPGFTTPEGICVYHSASRSVFKVTLDANDTSKWEVG